MQIIFDCKKLEIIETDRAGEMKLPVSVIKSARRKIHVIRNAPNELTLRNWKSLHYEKLKGDMKQYKSIRVNDKYRIILTVENDNSGNPVATLYGIEDYHD